MLQKIRDWWALARAEHALMVAVGIIVGELLALKAVGVLHKLPYKLPYNEALLTPLLLPTVGPALIALATFIYNDYADYKSDKALKRLDRPLVAGRIKRSTALLASAVLFPAGALLSAPPGETPFAIAVAYAFLGWLYSVKLKKLPFVGNAFVASTMAVPFVYGGLAVGLLEFNALFVAGIAFFAGLGRELFQTLRDIRGDRRIGATTLPMVLGAKTTVRLSALFINAGIVMSVLALYFQSNLAPAPLAVFGSLLFASNALFVAVVAKILASQRQSVLKQCRNLSLLALALGLAAFLSLAVL